MFRGELHVNVNSLKIRTSPLTTWFGQHARKESYVAKADLLFLFVNEMKWGSTWKKVIFGIIKRKIWSKCYCRTLKRKQFSTIKCKVQNNCKIQTTKAEQANSYIPGGCFKEIIPMLILQAMDQLPKYRHKMCAKQSPLLAMLTSKLL